MMNPSLCFISSSSSSSPCLTPATIQKWIEKELADIAAEEKRLEEERKEEMERQKTLEREAQRQREIALANPLSDLNIFVTVDDPFADIIVENVLNDYGEVSNFGLSPSMNRLPIRAVKH